MSKINLKQYFVKNKVNLKGFVLDELKKYKHLSEISYSTLENNLYEYLVEQNTNNLNIEDFKPLGNESVIYEIFALLSTLIHSPEIDIEKIKGIISFPITFKKYKYLI